MAHRKNHHRSLEGGLSTDRALLDQFVQMAAESMELSCYDEAEATDAVVEEAERYDAALAEALSELVVKYPPADGATADDLWAAKGPYLVLMTLRGEGVGIWDGRWDEFYTREEIQKVEVFLEKKLGKFADDTGGGSLEEAFMDAADETCGGDDEDEDDEDDDGYDDDEDEDDEDDDGYDDDEEDADED